MQVRQLEDAVGIPLLERTGRHVAATAAGELVLEHTRRVMRELETATERLQALRGTVAGRVRIGTTEAMSSYLMPSILARLRSRHPELEIRLMTGAARGVGEAVVRDDLDLGIVVLPLRRRELIEEPLFLDRLVAVAVPRADWNVRRAVDPATLARYPLISHEPSNATRQLVDDWLERGGVSPHVGMESGTETAKRLAAAGLGVTVVPAVAVREEVKAGRLFARPLAPPLSLRMGTVRRRDKARGAAMEAVLSALAVLRRLDVRSRPGGERRHGNAPA
jgi:DNA-binding transcriptional LysR family regulator